MKTRIMFLILLFILIVPGSRATVKKEMSIDIIDGPIFEKEPHQYN